MSEDRITQRTVTVVMGIIAALAFVFSFGNVWALALRLGVPAPIAPLIAPVVDLSVVGLLVALRYGRAAVDAVAPVLLLGWGAVGPQLLRSFHTVATDAAAPAPAADTEPAYEPAPVSVEPEPVPAPAPPVTPKPAPVAPPTTLAPAAPAPAPAPAVKVPGPLLTEARSIAASHHAERGEPITAAQLKRRLGIGQPMATALHAAL
ncbi:DUF2637 domain-containing protein [Streptomyces sp. NPDC002519]